jgi:hypothetical protein
MVNMKLHPQDLQKIAHSPMSGIFRAAAAQMDSIRAESGSLLHNAEGPLWVPRRRA